MKLVSVADAYIQSGVGEQSGLGDKNNGDRRMLAIDPNPGDINRSLVMFDVSAIPDTATISAAMLTLCPRKDFPQGAGRIHEVRPVTSSWLESGVTWNTQPSVGSVTNSSRYSGAMACVAFSVGPDVQAWIDGTPNYGWQIADSDEGSGLARVEYGAREDAQAASPPLLIITYVY